MGYGEIGGGGSLQWQMTHARRKGTHVPPIANKPQQGEAIDPDVNDGDDLFVYIAAGSVVFAQPGGPVLVRVTLTRKDDVQLVWGAGAAGTVKQYADEIGGSEQRLKDLAGNLPNLDTGV